MSEKVKKISTMAVLLSVALILSYLESILSLNITLPGIKLGLSNIALVLVLYLYGDFYALLFGITKSVLSLLFLGRLASLFFSLTGTVFAVIIMIILKKFKCFSLFGVCVCGSIFHVWGQLAAAGIFYGGTTPLRLLPWLTICAVISGIIVSIPVWSILKSGIFEKLNFNSLNEL